MDEDERLERTDNQGIIITTKIKNVQAELRGLLKGAPKVVKNTLANEYGAAMQPSDYEEAAWFAGYRGDIGELLTVKEQGYNLDAPNGRINGTPFYIACSLGQQDMVEYMASTPGLVDINARNRTGATPFFAACNMGHDKIVRFLANKRLGDEFAVDIEEADDAGITPYVIASMNGHKEVIHQLDFSRQLRIEVLGLATTKPSEMSSMRF
mmetsp:Transcript_4415/g.5781  ORF Transcript_4415/g.5781 Transcript_4415/m.5781 type:complete len:210 (-) Transcript_4415:132-761(-)